MRNRQQDAVSMQTLGINMRVSVIIPVYNAEKYLRKAIESALDQKETDEVLLIEDGSPDGSLDLCKQLSRDNQKVRLYQHPDRKNHGAGATRNLGIKKAKCDFVAFLDADDYYLPGRFNATKERLSTNGLIDGVYEAIGMHFYDDEGKERWLEQGGELLTTLYECGKPNRVFEHLLDLNEGYIHLDGLVVKRDIFEKCGCFPENLPLHQDTALILKVAAFGQLVPGRLSEPVALRGIHMDNRITQNKDKLMSRYQLWETMFAWALEKRLSGKRLVKLYRKHIETSYRLAKRNKYPGFNSWPVTKLTVQSVKQHPFLFGAVLLSILYNTAN
jgi:glycosyltransferase involved in cell wall biosynthesis